MFIRKVPLQLKLSYAADPKNEPLSIITQGGVLCLSFPVSPLLAMLSPCVTDGRVVE